MKRFLWIIAIILSCFIFSSCSLNAYRTNSVENTSAEEIEVSLSAEDVFNIVAPSTVEIIAESTDFVSTGSGFVYDDGGVILTNYHVIEGCKSGYITSSDGEKYDIYCIIGYDKELDIAILTTAYKDGVPLKVRSEEVATGEKVYAIGSSLGLSGTFSDGIVSSASREIEGTEYIQITAPISEGNSGGPLVDEEGNVVGITTASIVDGQNINLAIPISKVKSVTKLQAPITMEEVTSESDPYELVNQYLQQYGNKGKQHYNNYYFISTGTGHTYDTIGDHMEISYREESKHLLNYAFDKAVVLILKTYDEPSETCETVLDDLTIYLYPDKKTCDITCVYKSIDGTVADVVARINEVSDIPICTKEVEFDTYIVEGNGFSDYETVDMTEKLIEGVKDSLCVFDQWLYFSIDDCRISDFGIDIYKLY